MAGHATKPYKNTLSGSVGAGMGALFNPGGRKYYILEHKVSSKYHKAGESQEIIVDNIEIGRDAQCQVRFDESFKTVSRHHAGIVRDGDMWKLVQISKTNSTFLNGRPIKTEWYLQNGDEIQLSVNGPKLGFIIPTGNKSTVGSIGLTRRLSLFRQQALRPYKTAITVLSCVLVLAVGGLVTWNIMLRDDFIKRGKELAQEIERNKAIADSLANELVLNNKKMHDYEERMNKLKKDVTTAWKEASKAREELDSIKFMGDKAPSDISVCYDNVYFIAVLLYVDGKMCEGYYSGTGFLLEDGRFVTARHVVNLWQSWSKKDAYINMMNVYANNGGDIKFKFIAKSCNGGEISFIYSPSSHPFTWGEYNIAVETVTIDGVEYVVRLQNEKTDYRDYAYFKVDNSTGGLPFESSYSAQLPAGTRLDILGFPKGVGAEDMNKLTPIYSESSVARKGLDTDGCILLSNSETDHGNSGGPVFIQKDGKYKVVGILSGADRLGSKTNPEKTDGIWKSRVVPLSALH